MKNSKDYVASLARGIEIIRAFTAPQEEERSTPARRIGPTDALTLSQVAERLGVARAVARRFLGVSAPRSPLESSVVLGL